MSSYILQCIRRHPSLEDVTLHWKCSVNLIKVFLFGIKDKLNMYMFTLTLLNAHVSVLLSMKLLKSIDLLRMFLYILGEYCSKGVIAC